MFNESDTAEFYKSMPDNEIIKLASNSSTLRKEVIPILITELKKRDLYDQYVNWIKNDTNSYEGTEREYLMANIENSICNDCNTETVLLGFSFELYYSYFIYSRNFSYQKIICRNCGRKRRLNSLWRNFCYGWWSKIGLLRTPYLLVSEAIKLFIVANESKKILNEFIDSNTGELRSLKENSITILDLITEFNESNESRINQ